MRIRIAYDTRYVYDRPARAIGQVLRVTPRGNEGLYIAKWRVELDADEAVRVGEDAFGNITHTFFTTKPAPHLTISVSGEVETTDTHGVLTGENERLPPEAYLRVTPLTTATGELHAFAQDVAGAGDKDGLTRLHALLQAVHKDVRFDTEATHSATTAGEAFAQGSGVCQDLSHIFIACARTLGIPARYVSGHLVRTDTIDQQASHAWAEALVPNLGWVGFDVANGICPAESHVRVATGFDYLSAAPVRGVRTGGGTEALSVKLAVADVAQRQTQSQTSA